AALLPEARVAAVTALGAAMPLQQGSANIDLVLTGALVDALGDPAESVRRAAITALMGAKLAALAKADSGTLAGAFGYRPQAGDDKRAAALARWKEWLAAGGRW
ncbi:MAG: hypothetical protein H0W72_11070, partial [Planctomycetes bacterium]|nr:hypothetical protein [Planctomycetota bacterium]